jgi:hypothetical protein
MGGRNNPSFKSREHVVGMEFSSGRQKCDLECIQHHHHDAITLVHPSQRAKGADFWGGGVNFWCVEVGEAAYYFQI